MKKIAILVLICMLLSVVLTACTTEETKPSTTGKVEDTAPEHEHKYGEEWVSDADNHYHVCECGEKSDSAAHTADKIGKCTVCGYKVTEVALPESIEGALDMAEYTQSSVTNGVLKTTNGTTTYVADGKNIYVFDTVNNIKYYGTLNDDGTVFYIILRDDPISPIEVDYNADESYMAGPAVNLANFLGTEEIHYGPVSLIEKFYTYGIVEEASEETEETEENGRTDFVESFENGVYSFSYVVTVAGFYGMDTTYTVNAEFTLSPDTYIIDYAKISYNDAEGWYYETYIFDQMAGFVNEYTPDKVLPESFDILDAAGKTLVFTDGKADSVTIAPNKAVEFTVANLVPDTAVIGALGISVAFADAEGNEFTGAWGYAEGDKIHFTVYKEGEVNAIISIGGEEYIIPLNVEYIAPAELTVNTYNDAWGEYTATNEATVYAGNTILISALVAEGCDPNFTWAVIGENAADAIVTENAEAYPSKMLEFKSDVPGTYTIEFTSTADATVKATMTITVEEFVTLDKLIAGKWMNENGDTILNIYPADEKSGALTVQYPDMDTGEALNAAFAYTNGANGFEVSDEAGLTVKVYADGTVEVTIGYYFTDLMAYQGEADPKPDDLPEIPSEGGSGEIVTVVSGADITHYATTTYSVTIAAGDTANFALVSNIESDNYILTVTFEEANVSCSNTFTGAMVSGDSFGFDYNFNWNGNLQFVNNGAEEITLVFTVAWAAV